MTVTTSAGKLALLGGTPVRSRPIAPPAWPPVSEATAKRLGDTYLSRAWSFDGPAERAFAAEFAAYHGAKHGVFMANGTVTLQCALAAHGVGRGDEVIVPGLTWVATAMAPHYLGATPVFADVKPDTLCLDPRKLEAAITPRTRAIIPVHLYGGAADLDAILAIARTRDLVVIEDCAHGHGGKWAGRGLGSWGHAGSFSFQQSKTLASGEGGICLTNDDQTATRLYRLKHIGYARGSGQGLAADGPSPGLTCHNFRGTEFQAVILQDQLKDLPALIATYNRNAARLERALAGVPNVRPQARGKRCDPQSYYCFGVLFDREAFAGVPLAKVHEALRAEVPGWTIGPTYGPVYKHMLFNLPPAGGANEREQGYRMAPGGCPVTDDVCERAAMMHHFWLSSDDATLDAMAEAITKVATRAAALRVLK